MFKKFASRIKNPKVILAVISGILLILVNLGIIDADLSAKATDVTNTVLGVMVAVGVFGNPDSHVKEAE